MDPDQQRSQKGVDSDQEPDNLDPDQEPDNLDHLWLQNGVYLI